jgi:predicted DNA-binding protein
MKEAIQKVSKNTGKNSEYIKGLVEKELKEIIKRSFYEPSNDRLTDDKKIKTPITKMFTQKKKNK